MQFHNSKRGVVLLLAFIIAVSLLSFNAFAEEPYINEANKESVQKMDTERVLHFQGQFDQMLTTYLGSTSMSTADINTAVAEMDWEVYLTALSEIVELEYADEAVQLTEEEINSLETSHPAMFDFYDALCERYASDNMVSTLNGPYEPATGITVTDSHDNGSSAIDSGTITVKLSGGTFLSKTSTITIRYSVTQKSKLSFSYSTTGTYSEFKVAGINASASGSYEAEVSTSGSVTVTIKCARKTKAELILGGFKLETIADSAKVTVDHNGLGSVTVAGNTVADGASVDVTSDGAVFAATANSGTTFLGWINAADNSVLSLNASFNLKPTGDMTVEPVFINSSSPVHYRVGKEYLTKSLADAISCATKASIKTIVPLNDGTVPSGTYTIASGMTLLIPFDTEDTLYTTSPAYVEGSYVKPTAYRTLALAEDAHIIVNGAISVSAKQSSAMGTNGSPQGKVGFLKMNGSSSITVNSGANLYAWGFITGSETASITIKSGGKVYENFQIADWRGGKVSLGMLGNNEEVFPLSQYYVQNIEVPLTLEYGSQEIGATAIDISIAGVQAPSVPFIGGEGMFRLTSGSITKRYDGTSDRLIVDIDGNLTMSSMNIKITEFLGQKVAINSPDYIVPLNSNITVNISSGNTVTINQDLVFLPGAEMNIEAGATLTVASGYQLFLYDSDEWGGYCASTNLRWKQLKYAPGRSYTRIDSDLKDARLLVNGILNASAGYIYTTTGGADICCTDGTVALANLTADTATTIMYSATQGSDSASYNEIAITPAKLRREDGTYLDTTTSAYYYAHQICEHESENTAAEHGNWYAGKHTVTSVTTAPTCTEQGYTTHTCTCGHSYMDSYVKASHTPGTAVRKNVVEATFDAAGSYDSVIYCETCGEELSRQKHTIDKKIAAAKIGETRYETLAEAISKVEANGTVVLLAKSENAVTVTKPLVILKNGFTAAITVGEEYTVTESAEAYVIGRKDLFDFQAANVNMGNDLDMMFAFSNTALESWDGHYVEIVRTYAEPRQDANGNTVEKDTVTVPFKDWQTNGSYYVVTYSGLAAKEMCDILTLTVYDKDKNAVSNPWVDSMRSYAMRILALSSVDTQKTLAVDFLNYGAAAQTHFGYDADNLANSLLKEEQKKLASTAKTYEDKLSHGEKFAGSSLVLESNLRFNVAITDLTADMTATVSFVDHYGTEVTEAAVIDMEGKALCVQTNALVVADARRVITITVKKADGTAYATCQESIEAYLARYAQTVQSPSELDAAVMKFADSAYAYLHRNDK